MPSGRAVSGPDQGGCQQASVAQYGPPFNELLTVLSLNRSDILPFISGISEGLRTVPSFAFLYLGEMDKIPGFNSGLFASIWCVRCFFMFNAYLF